MVLGPITDYCQLSGEYSIGSGYKSVQVDLALALLFIIDFGGQLRSIASHHERRRRPAPG